MAKVRSAKRRQPADDKDRLAIATVEAMPDRKGRLDREVLVVEVLSGYRGAKKGVPDAETGALKGGIAGYEEIRTRYGPRATDHMEGARKAMGRAEGPEGRLSRDQTLVRTSKYARPTFPRTFVGELLSEPGRPFP